MEKEQTDKEVSEKTFMEEPVVLEKHRAAALIADGKQNQEEGGLLSTREWAAKIALKLDI